MVIYVRSGIIKVYTSMAETANEAMFCSFSIDAIGVQKNGRSNGKMYLTLSLDI
jgi:hypothetical protein